MSKHTLRLSLLLLITAFFGSNAYAYKYNICVRVLTDLSDDHIGEDYGKSKLYDGEYYWRLRGARYRLFDKNNNKPGDGYLNKNGCTGKFSTPYSAGFRLSFWSKGKLKAGNKLEVRSTSSNQVGSYSRRNIALPKRGGTGSKALRINGNNYCIQIDKTDGDNRRKFVMAHEYGHVNLLAIDGYVSDCSFGSGGSSFHGRKTLEYQSCAAMEGWPHFVAAASWNNRNGDDPDGKFRWWGFGNNIVSVDRVSNYCADAPGNQCDGGYGYEADWLRHLWDY